MLKLTYFFRRGKKKKLNYFNDRLKKLERKVNMLCSSVYGKKEKKPKMYQYNKRGVDGRFICKAE